MVGAACVLTTVIALRAPGMDLTRVPMFAWSMLVAAAMWLVSLPVLIGTLLLVYVDHRHGQHTFGRNNQIYSHILWALRHPQVYAFAVPVLGFAGDVLATTARTRQAMRGVAMGAIAAFGFLGFGAFLQLSVYSEAVNQPAYIGVSMLAVLPVVVLAVLWADLFRRGSFGFNAPMMFAVAAVLMLLVAVLAGAIGSISAVDVANTTWDTAVTHYATLATMIAILGGLHWWATKVLRRPVSEGLGVVSALVLLLGTVLLAFPDILSALIGNRGEKRAGVESLNTVAAAGGAVVILGVLVAVINLLGGLRKPDGEVAADPWQGQTLEWSTASPPPLDNFAELPMVESAEPLLDQHEEAPT
jgi:heme/copper-type cytochrome/quinol oxidase subunit 1